MRCFAGAPVAWRETSFLFPFLPAHLDADLPFVPQGKKIAPTGRDYVWGCGGRSALSSRLRYNSCVRVARIVLSLFLAAAPAGLPFVGSGFHAFCVPAILPGSPDRLPLTARQVARAIEAHYRHTKTMSAVFLETYRSGGTGIRAESGKVYFSRPGRMRWDYDSPEKKLFLVDGKNVWYYVPADHTASRTSIKQSSDWRTPLALLAGKVNLEKLCGSLELAPATRQPASRAANLNDTTEAATEAGNEVLVCTPRKEDQDAFTEVLFEVNPRDQLARVTIRQPGDIETEFRFGDWHENVSIAESQFHFEPPTGVAIVDDASLANKAQ